MENIERISYKLTNSFYEINADTMWACKDIIRNLSYSPNKSSRLRDKPLSAETRVFDE